MHRITRVSAVALALAATLVAGCGDDDPSEPAIQGEYSLQISGDMTENATGGAWFGEDTDENGQPIFAVLLGNETSRHLLIAARPGATRPASGAYPVIDPMGSGTGWTVVHIVSSGDDLLGVFTATTGTLTITESASGVLKGTLEYDAAGMLGQAEGSISASATFTAEPAPGR